MVQRLFGAFLALFVIIAVALPAQAKVYDGLTFEELFDIFDASDMSFGVRDGGIKILRGPYIALDGCETNDKCTDIVFTITFTDILPTLEQVNKWNQLYKIPEASVNNDGTLLFEMYLVTDGVTDTAILETTRWFWNTIVEEIKFWDEPAKPTS